MRRAIILRVAVLIAAFLFALAPLAIALAHEGHKLTNPAYKEMGYFSQTGAYLYGLQRDRSNAMYGQIVNCCKYGGEGDCQVFPVENVKVVPGGYEVGGEFIAEAETTPSPDDNYYRCQHAGQPSHCFFAPPQGF